MKKQQTLLVILFILLSGCQAVKEVHYFKSGENYYRLNVKSRAFASKSRYIAGYFDESAVNNYFSELSQSDSICFIHKSSTVNGKTESQSLENNDNRELVMILSTNSDVVSEQIGNLAQNEQTLEVLARLANKEKIQENKMLNIELTEVIDKNKAIVETGKTYINSLPDNDTVSAQLLLNYLNYISAIRGYNQYFETIGDAVEWLNEKN